MKRWSLYKKNKQGKTTRIAGPGLEVSDLQDLEYKENKYWVTYDKREWPVGHENEDHPTGNTLKPDEKNANVKAPMYAKMFDYRSDHQVVEIVYALFFEMSGFAGFRCETTSRRKRNFLWGRWGRHEGDWEHVTVRLRWDSKKNTYCLMGVFCGQHSKSKWYENNDLKFEKDTQHTILYIALSTHAIYNKEATYSLKKIAGAGGPLAPPAGINWLKAMDYTKPSKSGLRIYSEPKTIYDTIYWKPDIVIDVINDECSFNILKFEGRFGLWQVDNTHIDRSAPKHDYSCKSILDWGNFHKFFLAKFLNLSVARKKFYNNAPQSPEYQGINCIGQGWWRKKDHDSKPLPKLL